MEIVFGAESCLSNRPTSKTGIGSPGKRWQPVARTQRRHLLQIEKSQTKYAHCMRYWTVTLASAGLVVQPAAAVCTATVSDAPAP